jgi:hypothetical protein
VVARCRRGVGYAVRGNRAHLIQVQGGPIAAAPLSQIITSTILGDEPFDPYPTEGNMREDSQAFSLDPAVRILKMGITPYPCGQRPQSSLPSE